MNAFVTETSPYYTDDSACRALPNHDSHSHFFFSFYSICFQHVAMRGNPACAHYLISIVHRDNCLKAPRDIDTVFLGLGS